MFPMLALAALSAFAGYQYSKNKSLKKQNEQLSQQSSATKTATDDSSTAKNVNTYNYYTNESESGNTLFGSQKKTKRNLFGGEQV